MHVLDRLWALLGGNANSDVLEGALILVVLISIASVGPAVCSQSVELVREDTIQLVHAAVAISLCIIERNHGRLAESGKPAVSMELTATPRGAPWYSPFRWPAGAATPLILAAPRASRDPAAAIFRCVDP